VGACAGCDPHPDPPSDCATIRAQIEANKEQAEKLAEQNHAKITQNVAAGVVVVWPDSFAMDARRAAGRKWMHSNPVSSISPRWPSSAARNRPLPFRRLLARRRVTRA
jgi:hypothetical protein